MGTDLPALVFVHEPPAKRYWETVNPVYLFVNVKLPLAACVELVGVVL